MMKITQEHEKCIGCGACVALCGDHWEMRDDGKAGLKGGKDELETEDAGCSKEAANICPVKCIHVKEE